MTVTEPPAEQPSSWQPWGFWVTAGLGLAVLAFYLVSSVIAVIPLMTGLSGEGFDSLTLESVNSNPNVVVVSTLIAAVLGAILILFIAGRRQGASWREYLSVRLPTAKELFVWLVIIVVVVNLMGLLGTLLDRPAVHDFWSELYQASAIVPLLILAVFAGPLFEESLFRGLLFTGWVNSKLGGTGTVVLTAVLFALLHVQYDLFDLGQVFVLGILLGIARYRTGSLLVPIAMQVLTNAIAFMQLAFVLNG